VDLELQCKAVKIKALLMVRDVPTRWNSSASMLEQALQLREALKLLVVMEQHNRHRGARLSRFKLSREEWDLLAQLFPVLDVWHLADNRNVPLIHCFYCRSFLAPHNKFRRIQLLYSMTSYHSSISSHGSSTAL
jgi:hypothetical protein